MKSKNRFLWEERVRTLLKENILKKKLVNRLVKNYVESKGNLFGNVPAPKSVFISVIGQCNLMCKMCDIGLANIDRQAKNQSFALNIQGEGPDLSFEQLKKVINEFAPYQPMVTLGGGEPTLSRHLPQLVDHLSREKKLMTVLVSNGTLLHKYTPQLVKSRLDKLCISIDGPEKIHDEIRGVKGSFQKAFSALEAMITERRKQKSLFPTIQVNFTISNHNYQYLTEFVEMFDEIDIDAINVFHLYFKDEEMVRLHNQKYDEDFQTTISNVGCIDISKIDVNELAAQIEVLRQSKRNIFFGPDLTSQEIKRYYQEPLSFVHNDRCYVAWDQTAIMSNGDVLPNGACISYKLGNVRETSLKEIWNGQRYSHFRSILERDGNFPVCSRCCGIFARPKEGMNSVEGGLS
jgi:radical SAM protein with 4Fe4S-binding SPASM domain